YRQRLAHLLDLAYIPHPLTPEGRSDRSCRAWDTIRRSADRPTPIKVQRVSEAIPLILAGKTVELPNVRKVDTLVSRLAKMAKEARARGDEAPTYADNAE